MINKINIDNLERFCKAFEGVSETPYLDSGNILTIGIGHTNKSIAYFNENTIWSPKIIREVWLKDLNQAIKLANLWIIRPVPERMFDMAVDLIFNVGRPPTFIRKLNEGNFEEARNQLLRWIYDDGKVQLGLVKRCFARYMYFNDEDWKQFANCKASSKDTSELNNLIEKLGYRLIFDSKTRFRLQRFKSPEDNNV